MGIAHDTGIFRYSCASPKTYRVAADLLEYGFDAPALLDSTIQAEKDICTESGDGTSIVREYSVHG